MSQIIELIDSRLNGRTVLLLFIVTNLAYLFMMVVTIPEVMSYSEGMSILDMMPGGYDATYVRILFDTLGPQGRGAYLFNQIPADMVYPLLFAITYSLLFAYFLKKTGKLNTPYLYFCILPLIAGLADYAENVGIITMLHQYPDLSLASIKASNIFSLVKSSTTTVYFVALIILLVMFGIRSLRGRRHMQQ